MTKKRVLLIISIIILISLPLVAYAHPGSLDSNGGHYNRRTGEYHYHEGLHTSDDNSSDNTYEYTYTTNYTTTKRTEHTTENSITTTNSSDKNSNKDTDTKPVIKKLTIFYVVSSLFVIVALLLYHKADKDDIIYLNGKIKNLEYTVKEKDNTIQQVVDEANSNINILVNRNNEAQTKLQQADNIITTITKNNSIYQIAKVPPNTKIHIMDNSYTIYQKGYDGIYGKYTGYVSASGNKYHFVKGCSGATIPVCLFDKNMIGDRTPCSKCYEPLIDDELLQAPNWFMPYCKIKEYTDKHIYDKNSNNEN